MKTGDEPACVVEDEAEDRAGDDGADEEASEPDEVATAQGVVGALIGHSPGSLSIWQVTRRSTSALRRTRGSPPQPGSDDGAKLPQRTGPTNPGIGAAPVGLGRGLRSAVVMVAAVLSWVVLGACEN